MRKIIVEVPDECTRQCPLARKRSYPYNMFLKCPHRDLGFDAVLELEPTKSCKEAEVSK
jgi:hypothetical protein